MLLASSIQLVSDNFDFEVGQPFTVLGRVVNELGHPVVGVTVSADDGVLLNSRSLGATTPLGYFTLDYSAAQTQSAGIGLYMVRLATSDGAVAGVVLNGADPAAPRFPIRDTSITYGSAGTQRAATVQSLAAPAAIFEGAFDWVSSATKAVAQKTANLFDVDFSGRVTADDFFAVGKEILPTAMEVFEDFALENFRSEGTTVTPWGYVSGMVNMASWVMTPYALPTQVILFSAGSIVDSLQGLDLISQGTADKLSEVIDGVDLGTSLVQTFALDPITKLTSADDYFNLVEKLVDSFNLGQDLRNVPLELEEDALGNLLGFKIVLAPTDPSTGPELGWSSTSSA